MKAYPRSIHPTFYCPLYCFAIRCLKSGVEDLLTLHRKNDHVRYRVTVAGEGRYDSKIVFDQPLKMLFVCFTSVSFSLLISVDYYSWLQYSCLWFWMSKCVGIVIIWCNYSNYSNYCKFFQFPDYQYILIAY